jgi:hypothetical protein
LRYPQTIAFSVRQRAPVTPWGALMRRMGLLHEARIVSNAFQPLFRGPLRETLLKHALNNSISLKELAE